VAEFSLKPPQNQNTSFDPMKGIALIRFVMTVAPHRDICPQTKTYPKKAIAIWIRRIVVPLHHTLLREYLLFIIPREIWNRSMKEKSVAPDK